MASGYSDELLQETVDIVHKHGGIKPASRATGIPSSTLQDRYKKAAARGLLGTAPVLPGFRISKTTAVTDKDGDVVREFIQQRPEAGEQFSVPDGHAIKGVSALVDAHGNTIQQWVKTNQAQQAVESAIRAVVDELKKELPRVEPTAGPQSGNEMLANQYTITDLHMGMLAWAEETRRANWDLVIAEKLLLDWFSAAIAIAPNSYLGILAQIGDLMHQDSHESVTPTNRNVLDADSRFQKIIRVVIRVVRQIIAMLLQKHQRLHVVWADANHDPASSAWMRELLCAMYENEPRITIDNSPDTYYVYEHGKTALFYHHGHKRNINNIDGVFAGKFREIYGRCTKAYAHIGHLHNDEVKETNLMRIERHRTLAPADAYANSGGWLAERDAKVITYHQEFGEVFRSTLSPQMVAGSMNNMEASNAPSSPVSIASARHAKKAKPVPHAKRRAHAGGGRGGRTHRPQRAGG